MNNCYLYRHIRNDKNCVFYIGIGAHSKKKNKYSRAYSTNRTAFWKKITTKTSYTVEVIFDYITRDEAIRKEIEFIELYGRSNLKKGTLCNLTSGGEGVCGMVHSDETKRKMSQTAMGKIISDQQREKARLNSTGNKNCTGYKHGAEFKEKCRVAQTGKKMTDDAKRKIGEYWKGREKSKESRIKISKTLKGHIISDNVRAKIKNTLLSKQPKINQMSDKKELIRTFNTTEDAAIFLGRTINSIRNALRNSNQNRKSTKGYYLTRKIA